MAKAISLSQLRADRRALAARLALVDRAILALEALGTENGRVAPAKRSHHKRGASPRQHAASTNGGAPTIREAVTEIVQAQPGILARDVVNRLVGHVALGSTDPKKLLSTRVGQFVKAGRLTKDRDGGLHLPV